MQTTKWPTGKNIFKLFFVIILLILAPAGPARAQEITVSAAISLKDAFVELGKTFEARQKGTLVLIQLWGLGGPGSADFSRCTGRCVCRGRAEGNG